MPTLVEEEIDCPKCKCRIKVTIPVRRIGLSPHGSKICRDGDIKVVEVKQKK